MVPEAELILRVITLWFLVLSQFFRDGMGPFKHTNAVSFKCFFMFSRASLNASYNQYMEQHENFCRNPNNDVNGPWCFTSLETGRMEYCDIPYCGRLFLLDWFHFGSL